MKLKVLKPTILDGKKVEVGEIVESDSKFLANIKKAKIVDDKTPVGKPKKAKKVTEPKND